MANDWICLVVNGQYHHGDKKKSFREINLIFGRDLIEHKTVCAPSLMATGEYYVFVRCGNYSEHIDALSKSSAVLKVVPAYTNPHLFSEKEIDEFSGSVDAPVRERELDIGDMVLIKAGWLKSLYGEILKRLKNGKYIVAFSFYTRRFKERLCGTDLEFVAKVSKVDSKPSRKPKKRTSVGNHHKIRRQKRRKYTRRKKQ